MEYLGLLFMVVGVFLGAIWTNESWGRYWSWEPKETWALITILVYAVLLHWRWFAGATRHLRFNLLSQWAILVVLMTYFGVNYLLAGMHSYGSTGALASLPAIVYIAAALFFLAPFSYAVIMRRLAKPR